MAVTHQSDSNCSVKSRRKAPLFSADITQYRVSDYLQYCCNIVPVGATTPACRPGLYYTTVVVSGDALSSRLSTRRLTVASHASKARLFYPFDNVGFPSVTNTMVQPLEYFPPVSVELPPAVVWTGLRGLAFCVLTLCCWCFRNATHRAHHTSASRVWLLRSNRAETCEATGMRAAVVVGSGHGQVALV